MHFLLALYFACVATLNLEHPGVQDHKQLPKPNQIALLSEASKVDVAPHGSLRAEVKDASKEKHNDSSSTTEPKEANNSGANFDPFTPAPPPPQKDTNNTAAKVIFAIVILAAVMVGVMFYLVWQ